jgi:hypothetical protein
MLPGPSSPPPAGHPRPRRLPLLAVAAALGAAVTLLGAAAARAPGADRPAAALPPPSGPAVAPAAPRGPAIPTPDRIDTGLGGAARSAPAGAPRPPAAGQVGRPVLVAAPAIDLLARVTPVGLEAGGAMQVPASDRAGWYDLGPRPGQPGPAVLAGHLDSGSGPAVFFRLRELGPGDEVVVTDERGTARTFTVERVQRSPKAALPVSSIWAPTPTAALRLVTCAGAYDRAGGGYQDNLVLYATLAAAQPGRGR